MEGKASDWRPGPTVCRCCLTEGCYKDISTEYFWMGKREVYAEMLADTLNVSIAYSKSGGPNSNSRLICEPCISRLRDASDFKRQVLDCEKTFMHHLDPGSTSKTKELESIGDVKVELVKREKETNSDDDFDDRPDFLDIDTEDDMDDQPLTKLASKIPKKESVDLLDLLDSSQITVKRKSNLKLKAPPKKIAKKKEVVAKPSASKPAATKPAEKKKEQVKLNAELLLQYSTLYPFRLRGKNLKCVYCCVEIEDPDEFRCHMDLIHKNVNLLAAFAHVSIVTKARTKDFLKVDCTNLKCRLCEEPCETIILVAQHLKENHENDVRHLDLNYDLGLDSYRLIKDKLICSLCDVRMPTLINLVRHMASHYSDYACDLCDKRYRNLSSLKQHKRFYHTNNYICRRCKKEFSTLKEKKDHLKTSSSCWENVCNYCHERFSTFEMKLEHLVSKHNEKPVTYPCPDCGIVFESSRNFYDHYKVAHKDLLYMCSTCGKRFARTSNYKDHLLIHTNQEQYQCKVCPRLFKRQKNLKVHERSHIEETRRLDCLVCDKTYASKSALGFHIRNAHKQT